FVTGLAAFLALTAIATFDRPGPRTLVLYAVTALVIVGAFQLAMDAVLGLRMPMGWLFWAARAESAPPAPSPFVSARPRADTSATSPSQALQRRYVPLSSLASWPPGIRPAAPGKGDFHEDDPIRQVRGTAAGGRRVAGRGAAGHGARRAPPSVRPAGACQGARPQGQGAPSPPLPARGASAAAPGRASPPLRAAHAAAEVLAPSVRGGPCAAHRLQPALRR